MRHNNLIKLNNYLKKIRCKNKMHSYIKCKFEIYSYCLDYFLILLLKFGKNKNTKLIRFPSNTYILLYILKSLYWLV